MARATGILPSCVPVFLWFFRASLTALQEPVKLLGLSKISRSAGSFWPWPREDSWADAPSWEILAGGLPGTVPRLFPSHSSSNLCALWIFAQGTSSRAPSRTFRMPAQRARGGAAHPQPSRLWDRCFGRNLSCSHSATERLLFLSRWICPQLDTCDYSPLSSVAVGRACWSSAQPSWKQCSKAASYQIGTACGGNPGAWAVSHLALDGPQSRLS